MRTLLVGQDCQRRDALREILERRGHAVTICEDGGAALDAWWRDAFPLVVLAAEPGDMPMAELCRRLRALPRSSQAVICVALPHGDPQTVATLLDAGATDCLVPPHDPALLETRIAIAERSTTIATERPHGDHTRQQIQKAVQALANVSPAAVLTLDARGAVRAWNRAAERLYGWSAAEVLEQQLPTIPRDQRGEFHRLLSAALGGQVLDGRTALRQAKDGSSLRVRVTAMPLGETVLVMEEGTEHLGPMDRQQDAQERFRALVESTADMIAIVDATGTIRYVNVAVTATLEYPPEEIIGQSAFSLVHPDDMPAVQGAFAEVVSQSEIPLRLEFRVRDRNGEWRYLDVVARNLLDVPSVQGIGLTARDTTERLALEQQLAQQAFYDPLTALPNRALFMNRLEHALAQGTRRDTEIAVLFIDLDNFKAVNDRFGHAAGDQVLVSIGHRFEWCVRSGDTIARLGGDEFTILLEGIVHVDDAVQVAQRILDQLTLPFHLEHGHEASITGSVGIAVSSNEHLDAEQLLHEADVALYQAKALGKSRLAVFSPSPQTH